MKTPSRSKFRVNVWTVLCKRSVRLEFSSGRKFGRYRVNVVVFMTEVSNYPSNSTCLIPFCFNALSTKPSASPTSSSLSSSLSIFSCPPLFSVVLSFTLIHPFGFLVFPDSQGSVIADLEVQFKNDVSESEIRELTDKITEDGKLGPLSVDDFSVGPTAQR